MTIRRRALFAILLAVLLAAGCQPAASAVPAANPAKATPTGTPAATGLPPTPGPTDTAVAFPTETLAPAAAVVEPGMVVFIRPPTVQYVSSRSATVVLELDAPGGYSLRYWPEAGSLDQAASIALDPSSTGQVIRLEGLQPESVYFAAVLAGGEAGSFTAPVFGGQIWEPVRFRTLPESGLPVRIALLGDSGFGEVLTSDLAQAMAEMEPDIFIHTGDLVYNAGREDTPVAAFQYKFFDTLSPILHQAPVFPVVGNHELYDDARWNGRAYYYEVFPPLPELVDSQDWLKVQEGNREWYRLSLGPLQLLFLNTQLFYTGHLRGEQDQWLAERLADAAYQFNIPVFHVPPYTSGRHRLDGTPVIRSWVPLFEADSVPLVLSGHDHNYERLFQNDVTYLVSGGGSTALYPQGRPLDMSQVFHAQSHFVILDLEPGTIHVAAYDSAGQLLDQFSLELN